ncbi:MAG: hypothetical protein H6711_23210 [Myxococcales bacterium]|nr:hypothetical protein [Myxococcales bacterium]
MEGARRPSPAVVGAAAEGIVGASTFAGTDPWLAGLGGALAAAHAHFAGDPRSLALLSALKVAIEADARTGGGALDRAAARARCEPRSPAAAIPCGRPPAPA